MCVCGRGKRRPPLQVRWAERALMNWSPILCRSLQLAVWAHPPEIRGMLIQKPFCGGDFSSAAQQDSCFGRGTRKQTGLEAQCRELA